MQRQRHTSDLKGKEERQGGTRHPASGPWFIEHLADRRFNILQCIMPMAVKRDPGGMDIRALVGWNFARIRRERGLTQERVEERSGFSQQYLSGLEAGRRNPTVVTLAAIAQALDTDIADLIAQADRPPGPNKRRR